MTIKTFVFNAIQENTYVVSNNNAECIIVDCGAFYPEETEALFQYIEENSLKPVMQILTHGHLDHIMGVKAVYDRYGLQPVLGVHDEKLYRGAAEQATSLFGFELGYEMPQIGRLVKDGDTIEFGDVTFKVLETPGHTPGSVFYLSEKENVAFSGDTLFRGCIGRTDLPGGSMFQIIQSLRMVTQLPDTIEVFPGHGQSTTIGDELASNMYLDR